MVWAWVQQEPQDWWPSRSWRGSVGGQRQEQAPGPRQGRQRRWASQVWKQQPRNAPGVASQQPQGSDAGSTKQTPSSSERRIEPLTEAKRLGVLRKVLKELERTQCCPDAILILKQQEEQVQRDLTHSKPSSEKLRELERRLTAAETKLATAFKACTQATERVVKAQQVQVEALQTQREAQQMVERAAGDLSEFKNTIASSPETIMVSATNTPEDPRQQELRHYTTTIENLHQLAADIGADGSITLQGLVEAARTRIQLQLPPGIKQTDMSEPDPSEPDTPRTKVPRHKRNEDQRLATALAVEHPMDGAI